MLAATLAFPCAAGAQKFIGSPAQDLYDQASFYLDTQYFGPSKISIAELTEAHGQSGFAAAWLRHRGLAWAADMLPAPDTFPPAQSGQPKE